MQHILFYVPFSCQSTFLNQKPQQAVCVNEKVENQKQNGDITFCVPVVKKNYCLRVCLLCDSLFRSATTLGQMVLLLRISSWEMIRLVFNGMQGSKRNSFQWSTRQKRIVSVSRVQGRKKIVFSAVQGKKKSCLEIWLQLWQNFCLVLAIIIIIVSVIFSTIYCDGYHVFSYQMPGRSKCGPSESVPLF